MPARRFFLAFALALLGSVGLILYLDTREVDWAAYRPRSAKLDAAYPLGGPEWLLQLTVRSGLAMAYTRSIVYNFDTGHGYSLGNFEDQWYPMGFSDATLWLLREQSYVTSLRESQIMAHLNAPPEVHTTLEIWQGGHVRPLRHLLVRENGLPFVCGGRLASANYGNSDTMFYTVNQSDGLLEWFQLPEASPNLPFCGADGRIYIAVNDTSYYTEELDGASVKRKGKLQGQFALNGLWVGAPDAADCVYVAPVPGDQSAAAGLTRTTTLLVRDSVCAERMAVAGQVRALSTGHQTAVYVGAQAPQSFEGRLAGVDSHSFVLEQAGQGVSWLRQDATGEWSSQTVTHTTLFGMFPPLPDATSP